MMIIYMCENKYIFFFNKKKINIDDDNFHHVDTTEVTSKKANQPSKSKTQRI